MGPIIADSDQSATTNSDNILHDNDRMKYPEFAERFKQLISESPYSDKNQKEIGAWLGVSQALVSEWRSGYKLPSTKTAIKIAGKLKCEVEWLLTGRGEKRQIAHKIESNAEWFGTLDPWDDSTPLREDEVELHFFREVELAAGAGKFAVEENLGRKLRFSKATLRNNGVQQSNAACVTVTGNSMEPVLVDGTTIGIDKSITKIVDGEMYAIDHDGHLRVKLLYQTPGGGIRLRSYNREEYPDENLTAEQSKSVRIIGWVFWHSTLRKRRF